jgi:hypothetical protein
MTKQKANINVYLILEDKGKILLSKRQNTGYEDGKWWRILAPNATIIFVLLYKHFFRHFIA